MRSRWTSFSGMSYSQMPSLRRVKGLGTGASRPRRGYSSYLSWILTSMLDTIRYKAIMCVGMTVGFRILWAGTVKYILQ